MNGTTMSEQALGGQKLDVCGDGFQANKSVPSIIGSLSSLVMILCRFKDDC